MSWEDISAAPPTTRVDARPSEGFSVRRRIATAVLATGLLALGGVAVVNAADPSTSPTPSSGTEVAPDATTTPSQTDGSGTQPDTQGDRHHGPRAGAQGGAQGDCPGKGGSGTDQGTNDGGTTPTPSSTADPSDV